MNLWVTKWLLVFTRMALHGHSVTYTRWMPLEFSKSNTREPWSLDYLLWRNEPIGDKMIVGLCLNGLTWSFSDPNMMNAFGIFKIGYQEPLMPGLNSLWRDEPIVTKRLLVIMQTHMVCSLVTHTRWTPLEFWRSDHRGPRNPPPPPHPPTHQPLF